jgi:hypothetical protein
MTPRSGRVQQGGEMPIATSLALPLGTTIVLPSLLVILIIVVIVWFLFFR